MLSTIIGIKDLICKDTVPKKPVLNGAHALEISSEMEKCD